MRELCSGCPYQENLQLDNIHLVGPMLSELAIRGYVCDGTGPIEQALMDTVFSVPSPMKVKMCQLDRSILETLGITPTWRDRAVWQEARDEVVAEVLATVSESLSD